VVGSRIIGVVSTQPSTLTPATVVAVSRNTSQLPVHFVYFTSVAVADSGLVSHGEKTHAGQMFGQTGHLHEPLLCYLFFHGRKCLSCRKKFHLTGIGEFALFAGLVISAE